jgi:DNA-directed RNA polymerase subunit RPC12/RpoP
MIHFICPTCDKRLAVPDEKAGKIAVCPACQTRIIIPAAEPAPEAVTAEPPLKRRHAEADDEPAPSSRRRRVEADDDDDERPRRRRSDDDDDEIPDAEVDRPRRKKKRRRKRGGLIKIRWMPFAFDPYLITMAGVIFTAIFLMALSLVVPQFGYVSLALGVCMYLSGRIWFLSVAFSDDSIQGMLCLWCGPYNFVYLCMNFEDTKRPFFVEMTGEFIAIFSIISSGMLE